jgi:tellurite resistance protein
MDSQPAQDLHQIVSSVAINRDNLSAADRFVALDLSVKLMALVCAADGTLHDAEIELSRQVYEAHAGDVISHGTIRHAIRNVMEEPRAVWESLHTAHRLGERLREQLFTLAYHLAASDAEIHGDEVELLQRIAIALGIPEARREAIIAGSAAPAPKSAVPEPASSQVLKLAALFNTHGGKVLRRIFSRIHNERGLSAEQRSIAMDLTLKAMVLMSLSDNTVEDAELRITGEIYSALGGGEVASRTLLRAVEIVATEREQAWRDFVRAGQLDAGTRHDILRAAYRIAQIDGEIDDAEEAVLRKLGECLDIAADDLMLIASSTAAAD